MVSTVALNMLFTAEPWRILSDYFPFLNDTVSSSMNHCLVLLLFLLSFLHNYHSFSPKCFSNCPLLLLEYSDKLDFFQFVFFKKSPFWLLQSSLVFCLMHTCCSGLFLCHHHLCLPPGLDPLLPKVHTLLFPGSLPCFIGVHPPQTFLELVHGNFLKFFEILYVWKCLYST